MNGIEAAIGWAVLHSIWQASLIALALRVALSAAASSHARYAAACAALFISVAVFGLTFALLLPPHQAIDTRVNALPDIQAGIAAGDTVTGFRNLDLQHALPWVGVLWIAGVFVFNLRSLASYVAVRRLKRRGVCSAPDVWQVRLDALRRRLRIDKGVSLIESGLASVPAVIGHLRPIVLLPVGLLVTMPVEQIEALLIHELAHIRRYDYLVNVVQSFFESVMFYHPAIWWVSKTIRSEREHCCDDFVVASMGNAHAYATALSALEENRSRIGDLAMAASGGTLMKRIRRLLETPVNRKQTPSAAPLIACAGLLMFIGAAVVFAWPGHAPTVAQSPSIALQKWLDEDVVYIITPEERAAFEALRSDEERERFIDQFWERRDPTPGTLDNEYKDEHYRRIGYTNLHFASATAPGWKTDRGRTYILFGAPDEKESHLGGDYVRPNGQVVSFPFEVWAYRYLEGIGQNVIVEFADPMRTGEFRRVAPVGDWPR